jgi:hypothetical protein
VLFGEGLAWVLNLDALEAGGLQSAIWSRSFPVVVRAARPRWASAARVKAAFSGVDTVVMGDAPYLDSSV